MGNDWRTIRNKRRERKKERKRNISSWEMAGVIGELGGGGWSVI
jgi:hypothetical protein